MMMTSFPSLSSSMRRVLQQRTMHRFYYYNTTSSLQWTTATVSQPRQDGFVIRCTVEDSRRRIKSLSRQMNVPAVVGMTDSGEGSIGWATPCLRTLSVSNSGRLSFSHERIMLLPSLTTLQHRYYSTSCCVCSNSGSGSPSSPFANIVAMDKSDNGADSSSPPPPATTSTTKPRRRRKKKRFVPRKAAIQLTESARKLFQQLLKNNPSKDGILLNYHQSSTGEPRMVFSFRFVTKDELHEEDEGVTLEVNDDGTPKSPRETLDDGLPKLYVHHNAFIKVLGAKVDVDMENITPILYDKEGFEMDPNA